MSRRVEQVEIEYVPHALGIREAYLNESDDDEPVTLTIRPLTAGEYKARTAEIKLRNERGSISDNTQKVNQKLIRDCVVSVENYEYKNKDGVWTPVTDGRDLWAHGELAIVNEVLEVIPEFSQLQEGDKKKLSSLRDGSSQRTKAAAETPSIGSLGTVPTAKTS